MNEQAPAARPPEQKAGTVKFKAELRRAIRKNAQEPDINFLNITAMMDMMTIILVFMLKSMSASSAGVPESSDFKMPQSVLTTESSQEGIVVVLTKKNILVDGNEACPVPSNAVQGIEAKYKRSGPLDLYIVPVAQQLEAWREKDKAVRAAKGTTGPSEAIVVADADTPYRLLTEVMFTLGQTGFAKYHLMVLQGAKK